MGPTDRGGKGSIAERARSGLLSGRGALFGALAISLAVLVGFSISLLGGVGSSSSRTAAAIPQQKFFGIAQGIFRFDTQDLQTMAATGIGTDRFLLDWAVVQPTPNGPLAWPDKAIGALASHGIEAIPYVWGSPKWVTPAQQNAPVDSPQQEAAWQSFLKAAVARYGPKGSYWSGGYVQQYGANAKPVPIRAWQVWNEPNLKKFFTPGPDVNASAQKYARLVRISHDAIKGQDPRARMVLAGMPGFGDVTASEFLAALYGAPGFKGAYDAAALHPYAPNVEDLGHQIDQLRTTMAEHGDEDTPLWLTELGWGSGPPDRFRLNKGLAGQANLLNGAFELILNHRRAWKVQRVFWFDWRDPAPASQLAGTCSFCLSAGLLKYTRDPKPAYLAFKRFAGGG